MLLEIGNLEERSYSLVTAVCELFRHHTQQYIFNEFDRQLTVQELSVMMAHDLKPIIFLLNNSGYTIERYLHGKNRYVFIP